jgi:hypothetical protein
MESNYDYCVNGRRRYATYVANCLLPNDEPLNNNIIDITTEIIGLSSM